MRHLPALGVLAAASRAGANASFAQAERNATLQWTYAWSPERTLQVVFAAKTSEQWYVNSWDWSTY